MEQQCSHDAGKEFGPPALRMNLFVGRGCCHNLHNHKGRGRSSVSHPAGVGRCMHAMFEACRNLGVLQLLYVFMCGGWGFTRFRLAVDEQYVKLQFDQASYGTQLAQQFQP